MADRSLRGIRLGAQSLQSEEGVIFMERRESQYFCASCKITMTLTFAADAEPPPVWECRSCGTEAKLFGDGIAVETDEPEVKPVRTHWDMLLERRSREELEELLQERLNYLRERRGEASDI